MAYARILLSLVACLFTLASVARAAEPARKAENVIVVTLDGFRWQELFEGADASFMDSSQGGVKDVSGLKARYLREKAAERREVLMPFFWGTVAKQGQVFGNPARKASAKITNDLKFSYPGYSEIFCGFADPRIDSNAKKANPNLSVLEFLNGRPRFKDRVEAACTWDVFPSIFRSQQNGLRVHAGWEPIKGERLTERERSLNETMQFVPRYWPDNAFDVFTMGTARAALERRKPRVLYIGLGETDEWGHGRRYDLYLDSANKADQFLADLWASIQKEPQYKDKTALLITTDHGRGSTRVDWTSHGKSIPGAENIWIAVMGPDTPARGEREKIEVTQSQIAATIAALLGEDFNAASEKAAPQLPVFETASESKTKAEAVRVRIETDHDDIEIELNAKAPKTAANFLRYVDANLYDGGQFHRSVTKQNQPDSTIKIEVVQAGVAPARSKEEFPPIVLERTRDTGLSHRDGTISMARDEPDTATGDFFICIGDQPELDHGGKRNPDGQGFAAFGRVVKGMDIVKKIQAAPADGQTLKPPVKIIKVLRLP